MGIQISFQTPQIIRLLSLFLTLLCLTPVFCGTSDLIYRGCADQTFPDPTDQYTQNLQNVYDYLITQSSKTNFSKTIAGQGGESAIFGLYQCRGDLSAADCSNCVSQFPKLARKYCGENSIAVRIQLGGCYMRYEVVGFRQISSTDLLYKVCKGGVVSDGSFEGKKNGGFEEVESGVVSGNGFYAASYGSVYVMGQCEGDLVGSECGNCIRTAFERLKSECLNSMSGQVYLNQCYVTYTFYPNGVAEDKTSSPGSRQGATKTVAIVVGATAAAGFLVVILLFAKSAFKKKPSKYHSYGG